MADLPPSIAALVTAAAIRFGVRPAFARAVAWVESRGNQSAVSKTGAIGVMQLMPATAQGLGVDPHNLNANIEGGVRLLATHLRNFSEELSAAAYNAGPSALYKQPSEWPAETRDYVPKVMARAAIEERQSPLPGAVTENAAPPIAAALAIGLAVLGLAAVFGRRNA